MSYLDRLARYQIVFGAVGIAAAAVGFWQARDLDFAGSKFAGVGWASYELNLMTYNRLGAALALALAAVGLAAGVSRRPALGWIAAAGFAVIVVQGLIQTRPEGTNIFGSAGQTITFSLALTLVFAVTALLARHAPTPDNVP